MGHLKCKGDFKLENALHAGDDPPAGDSAGGAIIGVLLDHSEVGVEGDADGGVEGDLERRAQVLRADHGAQLLRVNLLLDLRKQLAEVGDLGLRLALHTQCTHAECQ